jgi:hypothetical protein
MGTEAGFRAAGAAVAFRETAKDFFMPAFE